MQNARLIEKQKMDNLSAKEGNVSTINVTNMYRS